ncbi:MAG: DUF4126 family protein [Planctomycetales bacterium]|nr:DUF4126 family protein [Planctomycetales bacterium]NIM10306.1 DUF4126 family protein [Planctomycetales bacterium]NIN09745.1 DUF4126 family protein [Planctomycetales bacterium]NIN78870.1 DUF4126 family protein [Planctomycetales bacterium]NIO36037.1 DUF4126 family protein [Planctomycetales bacterium]
MNLPDLPETLIALCIGIGLAASCGFRVFVPFLLASLATRAEYLELSAGFEWLATTPAIVALAAATVLEIGAYYVPWLDNLLDSVATPAAVMAGIVASAAYVTDVDPLLKWSVAIIAGGGIAGTIKAATVGVRLGSSATTGGLGNPLVATGEWVLSVFLSLLAILVPLLAALVACLLALLLARLGYRLARRLLGSSPENR